MQVILLKEVEKLGEKYDVVNVKTGFGRNYLIPRGMALIANKTNLAGLDEIKRKEAEEEALVLGAAQELAEKLTGAVLKIGAKAGASGKIFGSVTNIQIANAIKEQLSIDVERKFISIPEEVKTLGTYTAEVDLHTDLDTKVSFEVVAE